MDRSIFDDPERTEREAKYAKPEYAFQLRGGRKVGKKGVTLAHWRFLAAGEDTANALAELYGGEATVFDATKDHDMEVLSTSSTLEIVVESADVIEDKFIQWGPQGLPIHECDGLRSLMKEDKGEPCGCSGTLKQRKAKSRAQKGPGPSIHVPFHLAGAGEDLGLGRWIATSWQFAETIHDIKDALDDVGEPALCRLEIEAHEFTNEDGEVIKYKKPVLTVLGSYNAAIADVR